MKKINAGALAILIIVLLAGTACKKETVKDRQPVPLPVETGTFRIVSLVDPAGAVYNNGDLTAVVTVINQQNEEVVKEVTLTLNLAEGFTTEALQLAAGKYKISRFRLVYKGGATHFAAPLVNSAKAVLVQQPLPIELVISPSVVNQINVEAVKVNGQQPELFGYSPGSFGEADPDNLYRQVRLKAEITIGSVVYDSIPASLMLITLTNTGETLTSFHPMSAGVNNIKILKNAASYRFAVTKWGKTYEQIIAADKLTSETLLIFGGTHEEKKLKSEVLYDMVNGQYKATSKTEYQYGKNGQLAEIKYYLKRPDLSVYLDMTDRFIYNGDKVEGIVRYNEHGNKTANTWFTCDEQGRVHTIDHNENGQQTNGTVEYYNGTNNEVIIKYDYPGRTIGMTYYMTYRDGNLQSSAATTTNHSSELTHYTYDMNINPYVHMNWPNLHLSNNSKNNVVGINKEYQGHMPTNYPYSFNYQFDGDGYPVELIKHFKSYPSGQFAFSQKTVYNY